MEAHTFFLYLLVILVVARVFAEIAVRLNAPPVIGELVAGVIIGPSVLGLVEPLEPLRLLAEIGIILLLFEVGLSTDMKRLVNAGAKSMTVAILGFLVPLGFGYYIGHYMIGLSVLESMFIGGTLTATSIGITVRILRDLKLAHSHEGQIVLGAAVIDDVLGVILLALLYEFSVGGGVNLVNAGQVFVYVTAFFILAPILARFMSVVIKKAHYSGELPGVIPTAIVSLVLFFAWLAHIVGAPELLGGFAAGLALSRRFFLPLGITLRQDDNFANEIEQQMKPIIRLFTPIFFVVVGLSINLREIDWGSGDVWGYTLLILVMAVISKFAGAMVIKEHWASRILIGMSMVPRGEVGLIFAELGRISGIFSAEIHASMVLVIVFTTIIPPFVMKVFHRHYGHLLGDANLPGEHKSD